MATIYLRSTDGNDADDGSTWALAKATLAAALTAAGAGGTVYVSQNHAETQASAMTLTSPGTAATPVRVICVNDGAAPPTALATTATVTTTGANSISFTGFANAYGVTFNASTGGTTTHMSIASVDSMGWSCENCNFKLLNTSSTSRILVGASSSLDDGMVMWNNCSVTTSVAGQGIVPRGKLSWNGGVFTGVTATTGIIQSQANTSIPAPVLIRDVDLSSVGSGGSLVNFNNECSADITFTNCKLGSSVAITSGTHAGQGGATVRLINCDSADTNYRYYRETYAGTIVQETTIVRTGGSSDGTTGFSRKLVSSANASIWFPLVTDDMVLWSNGGTLTISAEVVTDNVTLTDVECWLEVEYLGTSGFPQSVFADDKAAADTFWLGAAGANQAVSSATWTTTGLTTPVKQQLSVSVTPTMPGPVRARVKLAKPSTTVYVCGKVDKV